MKNNSQRFSKLNNFSPSGHRPSYMDTALNHGKPQHPRPSRRIKIPGKGNFMVQVMGVMLVLSFVSGLLTFIPLAVYKHYNKQASFFELEPIQIAIRPITQAAYVSELDVNQKRDLASMVHYVASEIIETHGIDVVDHNDLAFQIVTESLIAEEDPFFITALILAESNFRNTARSHVGALGLMQIMPDTGKFIAKLINYNYGGKSSLTRPETNLKLGIAYIKYLKTLYKNDLRKTLIAYNWGPGNLARKPGSVPQVSKNYYKKITKYHNQWKGDYATRQHEFQYRTLQTVLS